MRNKVYIALLSLLLTSYFIQAQQVVSLRPLREVLLELEARFGIIFSYLDTSIEGHKVEDPPYTEDLEAVLIYLNKATGLIFQRIGEKDIAVRPDAIPVMEICAYLVDAKTGIPLRGATAQSAGSYAVSDQRGYLTLQSISGTDTLIIRHLGYETLSLSLRSHSPRACDTVYMRESVIRLEEIVVSNLLTTGIDKKADGSVAMDVHAMGMLPGLTEPDVLLTIQALPGIQSANELVSDINVRGGTHDQNLILWDGIKMYLTGHFFGLISAFNPYLIRDVNLIKNGTPAALSDGVSSIIDMQTFNAVPKKLSGGAGSNLLFADAFAKIPISRRIALNFAARRSISDLAQTITYDRYFERAFRNTDVANPSPNNDTSSGNRERFGFYDISAKLLFELGPADRLNLSFLHIQNDVNYEEFGNSGTAVENKSSGLTQGTLVTGLNYNRTWNNKFRTRVSAFLSSYTLEAINFDVGNDQRLEQENEVLDTGIKGDAGYRLSEKIDMNFGYQFIETGVSNLEDINNPPYRRFIKKVLRSHAGYSEINYAYRGTSFRVGMRANYIEKFRRWLPEPRLAFSQSFLKNFTLEVLGEFKNQTTTQIIDLQTDFLGVEKRRWVLADEVDIPVLTSRQASVGLQYQHGGYLLTADGYIKHVAGLTTSSQGFQNQYQYLRTTGSYDVVGLDVLFRKQKDNLNAWISYSFAVNTYNFPALQPASFPSNYDIRHIATMGSSYTLKKFLFAAGINGHSGRPFTEPLGVEDGEIIFSPANSSRLDNYLRIDLSAKYRFNMGKTATGELGVSFWNLSNRANVVNIFYRTDDNGQPVEIRQNALAFTPNLMFRVGF